MNGTWMKMPFLSRRQPCQNVKGSNLLAPAFVKRFLGHPQKNVKEAIKRNCQDMSRENAFKLSVHARRPPICTSTS